MTSQKKFGNQTSKEKAVIVYMMLAKRHKENRDAITYGIFSNQWDDLFKEDRYREAKDMKIQAFKYARSNFDDKSLEDIQAYRDTMRIYVGREVPKEIKELAQEKKVIVSLAENLNKHLSGFDILIKQGKNQTFRLVNTIPFGLSEEGVKKVLTELPTKKEIQEKEQHLMNMLTTSGGCSNHQKAVVVGRYKAPYATHEFKVFMNKFTLHECKSKELTNACVLLCNRVGINNLSNEAPILYKFCEGSGQREKNLKRIRNRRKGNAKATIKRKGR